MILLLLFSLGSFSQACAAESAALVEATTRVAQFDLAGAAGRLDDPALQGCTQAETGAIYLHALVAARAAYYRGGDPDSLRPVRDAIARLESIGRNSPGPAEIARLVLLAAAAAAQSERAEMEVFLEHAVQTELAQFNADQPGAPFATAHEVAGDLWLQVHQYEAARAAYDRAITRLGPRPRLILGLSRVAARTKDVKTACADYRAFIRLLGTGPRPTHELDEARMFLRQRACRSGLSRP